MRYEQARDGKLFCCTSCAMRSRGRPRGACKICGAELPKQAKFYCSRECRGVGQSQAVHPDLKTRFFREVDCPEKAYWAGFLLADGCVEPGGHVGRVQMLLAARDRDHVVRFCKAVGADPERIKDARVNGYARATIRFTSREMVQDLAALGVVPGKSKTARFPRFSEERLQHAALLGYYDGNGWLDGRAAARVATGSVALAEDILAIFGLPPACLKQKNPTVWVVRIPTPLLLEAANAYPEGALRRKLPDPNRRSLWTAKYGFDPESSDA